MKKIGKPLNRTGSTCSRLTEKAALAGLYAVLANCRVLGIALIFGGIIGHIGLAHASDMQANGMITIKSASDVKTTIDKLEAIVKEKGMNVFGRVNHAEGAAGAGLELRPTELLIFGNPKVGTPLMICSQSIAIDLPQKALAWQDEEGQVWLSYNDPAALKERHQTEGCDAVFDKVAGALSKFAAVATAP